MGMLTAESRHLLRCGRLRFTHARYPDRLVRTSVPP